MMLTLVQRRSIISFMNISRCSPSLLNISHFSTSSSDQKLANYLPSFIRNRSKPKVAVINLFGTIAADMGGRQFGGPKRLNLESLDKSIDKAFSMKNLKEVCLIVNSPGGSPVQSELIANKIIKLSEAKNVHVVSFVEDYAASGGYWLACAGKEIFVAENSIVGSVGVIYGGLGFHELIKRFGIERRVYTAGKSKTKLDPFLPLQERDVEFINKLLTKLHQNFINYVKQQRGARLKGTDDVLFNGDYWVGKEADDLGLIDGIDTFNNYVTKKFGSEVKVVKVNPPRSPGLASLFSTGTDFSALQDTVLQQKFKFF